MKERPEPIWKPAGKTFTEVAFDWLKMLQRTDERTLSCALLSLSDYGFSDYVKKIRESGVVVVEKRPVRLPRGWRVIEGGAGT